MKHLRNFLTNNRLTLAATLMITAMMTAAVAPSSAQSLDTSAFTTSITTGMQIFFDNLPAFVLIGFAVFGVIFAFLAGLRFARSLLSELLNGLSAGGK